MAMKMRAAFMPPEMGMRLIFATAKWRRLPADQKIVKSGQALLG
jgi:hypothetical protein